VKIEQKARKLALMHKWAVFWANVSYVYNSQNFYKSIHASPCPETVADISFPLSIFLRVIVWPLKALL